jgi:uncharacterized OB-fold protein
MVRLARDGRSIPDPTPVTAPFFAAAKEGRLILQTCSRDGPFFYPRGRCPRCWGADWRWIDASGRGTIYSFTIDRLGHDPAQKALAPFVIAIVTLEEGPRAVAQIVDCPFETVRTGMPVEAVFDLFQPADDREPVPILRFRPRG